MDEINIWLDCFETALKKVHTRYALKPETILTESDLKCWLFHELQTENKKKLLGALRSYSFCLFKCS